MTVLTLDKKGIAGAVALGIALLLLGGDKGWLLVAMMAYFLVFSYAVTLVRLEYKERRGFTERRRGLANVAANGMAPLAFAVVLYFGIAFSNNVLELAGIAGFIGAVAGITADKFASELGVLDGIPKEILTLKPTRKGRSGAVTPFGLAMSAVGAALAAAWAFPLGEAFPALAGGAAALLAIAAFSGFAGGLTDSVAGHFEERGIGSKHTSNLICSVVAGLLAAGIALMVL